jgi:hypothetical protein
MPTFPAMDTASERPEPSSEDPVEGRPDIPEEKDPGRARPELDPFPGYGEPPPEVRRESPPDVPRRDWGPTGNTAP